MRVYELVIEPGREEHISRHHITVDEVEEVVFSNPFITRTREQRFRLIGQTAAGRYLTVIVAARGVVRLGWSRQEMPMRLSDGAIRSTGGANQL